MYTLHCILYSVSDPRHCQRSETNSSFSNNPNIHCLSSIRNLPWLWQKRFLPNKKRNRIWPLQINTLVRKRGRDNKYKRIFRCECISRSRLVRHSLTKIWGLSTFDNIFSCCFLIGWLFHHAQDNWLRRNCRLIYASTYVLLSFLNSN